MLTITKITNNLYAKKELIVHELYVRHRLIKEFRLFSDALMQEDAIDDLKFQLFFLWKTYVRVNPTELTKDGLELRNKLLDYLQQLCPDCNQPVTFEFLDVLYTKNVLMVDVEHTKCSCDCFLNDTMIVPCSGVLNDLISKFPSNFEMKKFKFVNPNWIEITK